MKTNQDPPSAASALRRIAEERLKARESTPQSAIHTSQSEARLVHELQVHQIELEMQNEELQQVRAKAEALLAQYTDLYDFAPTGHLTLDREGAIRLVNLTGALELGVERSRLVNRRFGLFVAEGDRRAFGDFLAKVFASGAKESCEVALSREGSLPIVVRIEGTRSVDGQECRAVLLDITKHRHDEEQVRAAQVETQKLLALSDQSRRTLLSAAEDQEEARAEVQREQVLSNTIIDGIPGAFYVLDESGRYARWNNYQRDEILGKTDNQIAGMDAIDTIHPEDRPLIQSRIANVLQDGKEESVEGRVLLRGGPAFRWLLMTGRRLTIEGRPFLVGTGIDITARKQAESRDRLARATLELLNRSGKAEDGIRGILDLIKQNTGFDAVGIRLRQGDDFPYFVQSGFSGDFLLTENTLLARDAQGGICRDKDGHISLECTCGLVVSGRAEPSNPFFTPGGSFWTNNSVPLLDLPADQDPRLHPRNRCIHAGFLSVGLIPLRSGKEVIGLLQLNDHRPNRFNLETIQFFEGLSNSIGIALAHMQATEQREKLEKQLRQAQKLEAVGRLAGGVAHDFNNQLTVVLGLAEMVLSAMPADHPSRDDLEEIQRAGRRSADLTRQLLTFSRQQAIAPVVLDVSAAIAGSLKMLGRLVGENIRLNFVVPKELGCVCMDPGQLDQVVANLVVNARDAIAGTGKVSIEAANRTLQEADCRDQPDFVPPGDYVVLTIRDDGSGMTPEIQANIFEPFFTTKGVGKGTGLGLATVYGIVKQNNGAIAVQSAPGQGAVFTIYLPRSDNAALAAAEASDARMPHGTETVLLVEDEGPVLALVQRTLARQGYKVLTAALPGLALRMCEKYVEPIHLLLTDVIMPEMSGQELSERIRELRPGIRVLFMSGYTADIMEDQGHMSESHRVLKKPFTCLDLAQRVRAALDEPAAEPPA